MGLLHAVQFATRKLSSQGDLDRLLPEVLALCVEAVGAGGGTIYLHDANTRRLTFRHVLPESIKGRLPTDIADNFGVAGRVFHQQCSEISDFPQQDDTSRKTIEDNSGVRVLTMLSTPLMMAEEQPIGVVQLINKAGGSFDYNDVAVLETVAAVSTMAVANSRLMEESARASSLLGMGKVSHDIGNLVTNLWAHTSLMDDAVEEAWDGLPGMPADSPAGLALATISEETRDIKRTVDQLLRYSKLISDLSAGRALKPRRRPVSMEEEIRSSVSRLTGQAMNKHVALSLDLETQTPPFNGDAMYIHRIIQNLVGNCIHATHDIIPEPWLQANEDDLEAVYGTVTTRYRWDGQNHILEIQDEGPGMPAEAVKRLLAGKGRSSWGRGSGSGWGMRIVRELVTAHCGTLEIESAPGEGALFRVRFPSKQPTDAPEEVWLPGSLY